MGEEEIIDIVNENDEVIEQKPRKEAHKNNLLHRAVHVLVFNSKGEILLEKRSMKKKQYAGFWGDVGGHVEAGDQVEKAAARELKEEVGIEAELEFLVKFRKFYEGDQELITVFKCHHDGPFRTDPEEVELVKFFPPGEIKKMIESGEDFAPGAKIALLEYIKSL